MVVELGRAGSPIVAFTGEDHPLHEVGRQGASFIDPAHADLVRSKIDQYASDPGSLANKVTRLQGRLGFRLRVGDYRVIFMDDGAVLDILHVGHRREICR